MRRIVTAALFLLICATSYSQNEQIKVRFEFDRKLRKAPPDISFYRPNGQLLAKNKIADDQFQAPTLTSEKITVIIRFSGRTMDFREVPPAFFAGKWCVGIDTPPFGPALSLIRASSMAEPARSVRPFRIQVSPVDRATL
jgi:hypothetical protein